MPVGMGLAAGTAVATAAGKVVAVTVAAAMVEGMAAAASAVAVTAVAGMAEAGTVVVMAGVAMEVAARVVATVAVTVVAMVVAAMGRRRRNRRPHRHSNGHRGASVHPRSCKSDDCFPMRPRAARQVSRVRTPPMSRSAHCRAGSLCTERPSARAARTGGPRTARRAGRPAARSRCDNSRPC